MFLFSQTGFGLLNEGYGASSGVDESVLELDRDGDCTRHERTHLWIVYFKAVNFMLREFLLSETTLSYFKFDFTSGSVNHEEK